MSDDAVMRKAIKQRDLLLECAREFRHYGAMARTNTGREMAERDAKACEDAAEMMAKLGTEVTRLRQGIGCFFCGRLDRIELNAMTKNWNGDKPPDAAS